MSSMKEHLHEIHKAQHEDRAAAIANCKTALEKAAGMEPNGGPTTTYLKAEIVRHQSMLDHHAAGMEACAKANTADDLTKRDSLVPTNVSGVTPNRPPGLTAVPRFGAPPIPDKIPVPQGFEKIAGLEPEDWHSEEPSLR